MPATNRNATAVSPRIQVQPACSGPVRAAVARTASSVCPCTIWKAATTPGTKGGVFNLGNPNEITILKFARTVLELCGKPGMRIVKKPLPVNDPTRRKPDISRAKRVLKWQPRVTLKEGLGRTINYYQGRLR